MAIQKRALLLSTISLVILFSFSNASKSTLKLSSEIYKRKTIPYKYKNDSLIENLILRPPVFRYVRFKGDNISYVTYKKSKFSKFPKWINSFNNLKAIDLIGNNNFNYPIELNKIQNKSNIEYLAISPKKLDSTLVHHIIQFSNLKHLYIKKESTSNDNLALSKLKDNQNNCVIDISIFADYGDSYFSEKK